MGDVLAVNLRRFRKLNELTQEQLAKKAGLSRVGYRNLEKGTSEPRGPNLKALAKALKVSSVDLLRPAPQLENVRFRSHPTLTPQAKAEREQIVTETAIWLTNFSYLEKTLNKRSTPKFAGSQNKRLNIERLAQKARNKIGLAQDKCIPNVCEALAGFGVRVRFVKSKLKFFFGLSVADKHLGWAVVVNTAKDIPVERQIFTAAHEFGHLLMHQAAYDTSHVREDKPQEKEADDFAGHFLMPMKAFKEVWMENRGLHWIANILNTKRRFRVSYKSVIHRLIDVGIADNSLYKAFVSEYEKKTSAHLTFKQEPRPLRKSEEPSKLDQADFVEDRLGSLVRDALEQEKITISRAAEILGLSIAEMRQWIAKWEMLEWQ